METSNHPKGRPFESVQDEINFRFMNTNYEGTESALYLIIRHTDKDGEEQIERKYISNGVLLLTKSIVRDDGVSTESSVIITPIVNGKKLPSCEIPMDELENKMMSRISLEFRPAVGGNSKAYLNDSIRAQAPNAVKEVVFEYTGWTKLNHEWVYLCADGAVTKDGIDREIQSGLTGRNAQYSFAADKEDERWEANKKFFSVAPPKIMYPLLGIIALSPLNEALRQAHHEPAFVPFLLGRTGSMKSTLVALGLNYFGQKFSHETLPGSTKDTSNSIERNGFLLKDTLFVIDDFHPPMNAVQKTMLENKAQDSMRMWGDRTGKNRMYANGKNRPSNPVRGNVVLTGEDVPHIGQSGEARLLTIELQPGDVNKETMTELQQKPVLLNEVMCDYIQFLCPLYDELPEYLEKRFLELRAEAQNGGHGRVAESIAHLQIAIEVWSGFLKEKGQMSETEAKEFQDNAWEIFRELAEEQNKAIAEEKPTKVFLNAISELLETRAISIAPLSQNNSTLWHNQIGWMDNRFIYFKLDTTLNAVCEFLRAQDKKFPLSNKELLKHMREENLIVPSKDGGNTIKKKINGKATSVVCLYRAAVDVPCDDTEGCEE